MRKFIAPAVLALAMGAIAAQGAYAADAKPAAPAKPAAASPAKPSKHDACEAAWRAEKTHTAKHQDFVKSCEAKG